MTYPANNSDNTYNDELNWIILLWFLVLYIPVICIITPRTFDTDNALSNIVSQADNLSDFSMIIPRGLLLLFVAFCSLIIVRRYNRWSRWQRNKEYFFLFFLFGFGLSPLLATLLSNDKFQFAALSFTFLSAVTILLKTPALPWVILNVRRALLITFIYGSLLAAVLFPEWAIQQNYETALSIFNFRLYGTANHPNSLGPIALIFLILAFYRGTRLAGENYHRMAAVAVLFLSQSKTTWVIALVWLLGTIIWRVRNTKKGFLRFLVAILCLCSFVSCAVMIYYRAKESFDNPEVITLTGRLFLWIFSLEYWSESPWIGHGYSAWSSGRILDNIFILHWAAPNAHNQFLQTLTEAGIIGEFFLIGLLLSMIVQLAVKGKAERKVNLAVLLLLVGRSITEVVISYSLSSTMLLFWIMIVIIRSQGNINTQYSQLVTYQFKDNNS